MPERALRKFLEEHLPANPDVRGLVVAFSGGLDSSVLLHALLPVAEEFAMPVRAIHVHHGLSPNADAWAAHARHFCADCRVALEVLHVQVPQAASLEASARRARYEAFTGALQPGEALLMAQHRDDQAETFLFRLLRGAGVTGLAAMRPQRMLELAQGGHAPQWRPFLGMSRTSLEHHAEARGIKWIEDESNQALRHARNFLRHEVIPLLETRWPAARQVMAATAARMGEADALLREYAILLGEGCIDMEGRVSLPAFSKLSLPQQRLVLRHWLQGRGFLMPPEAVLEQIQRKLIPARQDAAPVVICGDGEIRRHRDHLHALKPLSDIPDAWEAEWDGRQPLQLPDGRLLHLEQGTRPKCVWRVRFRRGGERFRPAEGRPTRDLKNFLQESAIPPWQRARLPLVFDGEELVAVAGLVAPGLEKRLRFRIEVPEHSPRVKDRQ
ncbi:MAG: mesJ [Moraxellaceae bacterium]|jgi:tRNA(Ile)-lysidine synthase|nr:mesJ [Moraxellaceae bacterium]